MIVRWMASSIWHPLGLSLVSILVCLLVMYNLIWHGMDQSIAVLQREVARLDQESQGVIQKIGSLKAIEMEVAELRENLFSRVKQLPEDIESKIFRRDVVEIAKRRSVTVRVWKPEVPLMDLQHSETSIPITVKVEGDFQGTVQFLDELRQLPWVQSIPSIVMAKTKGNEDSSLIITNITLHGLTPLEIKRVQNMLNA